MHTQSLIGPRVVKRMCVASVSGVREFDEFWRRCRGVFSRKIAIRRSSRRSHRKTPSPDGWRRGCNASSFPPLVAASFQRAESGPQRHNTLNKMKSCCHGGRHGTFHHSAHFSDGFPGRECDAAVACSARSVSSLHSAGPAEPSVWSGHHVFRQTQRPGERPIEPGKTPDAPAGRPAADAGRNWPVGRRPLGTARRRLRGGLRRGVHGFRRRSR